MSVKCKACGFDSADGADWCEMCKEPFHKKLPAKPAAAAAAPAAKPPAQNLADAQAAAEFAALKKLTPEELLKRIPEELQRDPSEKIPTVPPWFRMAAYAFLFGLAILTVGLVAMTLMRSPRAGPTQTISHGIP
jgi:hypothetical protein